MRQHASFGNYRPGPVADFGAIAGNLRFAAGADVAQWGAAYQKVVIARALT